MFSSHSIDYYLYSCRNKKNTSIDRMNTSVSFFLDRRWIKRGLWCIDPCISGEEQIAVLCHPVDNPHLTQRKKSIDTVLLVSSLTFDVFDRQKPGLLSERHHKLKSTRRRRRRSWVCLFITDRMSFAIVELAVVETKKFQAEIVDGGRRCRTEQIN